MVGACFRFASGRLKHAVLRQFRMRSRSEPSKPSESLDARLTRSEANRTVAPYTVESADPIGCRVTRRNFPMTNTIETTTSVITVDRATTAGSGRGRSTALLVAAASLALAATGALVAHLIAAPDTSFGLEPVAGGTGADNSFDQAEHRRHLAIVHDRADGFDVAERARFERLSADALVMDANGFDVAERARFERLSDRARD